MDDNVQRIKEQTETLLEKMGVTGNVSVSTDENSAVVIEITDTDAGLLIGYEGEGLKALQHVIRIMQRNEGGQGPMILLDIEGYRKKQEDIFKKTVQDKALCVKETGKAEILEPMSSYKRRIVHMVALNVEGVTSESVGEGEQRRVMIKPEKE